MTNYSRWSLPYFGIRCDIVSVLSSNHFSFQQLNNHLTNHLLLLPNMPMLDSRTFQSASGVNTITRPVPKRSGGDYPSGQQVVVANLVSFCWRLICYNLDPWYGLHRPPSISGVQDSWDGQLSLGSGPLQPWRVEETQGSRTNWSTPTILWRIIRMRVIDPEAGEKAMDASTWSIVEQVVYSILPHGLL